MAVNWSNPCETEDGRPVRVLCTDRPYEHAPIVCMRDDGVIFTIGNDGAAISYPFIKVRNVTPKPVPCTGYINIYRKPDGRYVCSPYPYDSAADADDVSSPDKGAHFIGTVTWEETENA